jgi:hypothetical protein
MTAHASSTFPFFVLRFETLEDVDGLGFKEKTLESASLVHAFLFFGASPSSCASPLCSRAPIFTTVRSLSSSPALVRLRQTWVCGLFFPFFLGIFATRIFSVALSFYSVGRGVLWPSFSFFLALCGCMCIPFEYSWYVLQSLDSLSSRGKVGSQVRRQRFTGVWECIETRKGLLCGMMMMVTVIVMMQARYMDLWPAQGKCVARRPR